MQEFPILFHVVLGCSLTLMYTYILTIYSIVDVSLISSWDLFKLNRELKYSYLFIGIWLDYSKFIQFYDLKNI